MKIILCGKPSCCPTIEKKGNFVIIKDDYKQKVKMTVEQWRLLKEAEL